MKHNAFLTTSKQTLELETKTQNITCHCLVMTIPYNMTFLWLSELTSQLWDLWCWASLLDSITAQDWQQFLGVKPQRLQFTNINISDDFCCFLRYRPTHTRAPITFSPSPPPPPAALAITFCPLGAVGAVGAAIAYWQRSLVHWKTAPWVIFWFTKPSRLRTALKLPNLPSIWLKIVHLNGTFFTSFSQRISKVHR